GKVEVVPPREARLSPADGGYDMEKSPKASRGDLSQSSRGRAALRAFTDRRAGGQPSSRRQAPARRETTANSARRMVGRTCIQPTSRPGPEPAGVAVRALH